MRRIHTDLYKLADQLRRASEGIAGEPGWPGFAPTQAETAAAATAIRSAATNVIAIENDLSVARTALAMARADGTAIMRKIDGATTGLYGESGLQKHNFGLRPVDGVKNSRGPVPPIKKLSLSDGPKPGSLLAKWKAIVGASYDLQWFADETLETLVGSMASTRRQAVLENLVPGSHIWLRVRGTRAGRHGAWSETVSRYVNG